MFSVSASLAGEDPDRSRYVDTEQVGDEQDLVDVDSAVLEPVDEGRDTA